MAVRSDKMLYISVSNLSSGYQPRGLLQGHQGSPRHSSPAGEGSPQIPAHCPPTQVSSCPFNV